MCVRVRACACGRAGPARCASRPRAAVDVVADEEHGDRHHLQDDARPRPGGCHLGDHLARA
eukprot:509109-Pleurochrysis_carterae.AAC.1